MGAIETDHSMSAAASFAMCSQPRLGPLVADFEATMTNMNLLHPFFSTEFIPQCRILSLPISLFSSARSSARSSGKERQATLSGGGI
jgi:hypothetical protein